MNAANKIQLTEEKETLFITLYAKALDYHAKHSILHDKMADEIVESIDADLSKYKGFGNRITVVRARQIDEWAKDFIAVNPYAVVVYLGCGLDTRVSRICKTSETAWFDVDYPDVISLRRKFYADREGCQMIEASVTDGDWLEKIPRDRRVLIIAEGILEYITEEEVKILFKRITNYFLHGQVIFDVMNSFAIKSGSEKLKATTGAVHKWTVDRPSDVDKLNPKMKRMKVLSVFHSRYMSKLPVGLRLLLGFGSLFPRYRNMILLMRYKF